MYYLLPAFLASSLLVAPANADPNLERSFDGALRGCEEWLLNPASWADGPGPFIKVVGLGSQMSAVDRVEEVNLPPKQMRRAMHYWRINSTSAAGYILVVSDQLPMCHITGGGGTDLQPTVENVLLSPTFRQRWEQQKTSSKSGMTTTTFLNREDAALSITVSRAKLPSQRLARVQVIATATYRTGK